MGPKRFATQISGSRIDALTPTLIYAASVPTPRSMLAFLKINHICTEQAHTILLNLKLYYFSNIRKVSFIEESSITLLITLTKEFLKDSKS